MFTIFPYRVKGVWVFDDASKALTAEPFVLGTGEVLDGALRRANCFAGAHHGFKLEFSDTPLPGFEEAILDVPHNGGAYYVTDFGRGWLCPMLLRYFPTPPDALYFRVSPKVSAAEISEFYSNLSSTLLP